MAVLYSEPVYRRYLGRGCSFPAFVQLLLYVALIVFPFLICLRTGGLWVRDAEYTEQAALRFNEAIVVSFHGADGTAMAAWSSIRNVQRSLGSTARSPTVTSRSVDSNLDGVVDYFDFSLTLPLNPAENVHAVSLALGFNFQLVDMVDMTMQSLVFVQAMTPVHSGGVTITGDVKLRQVLPLPAHRYGAREVYNTPVISDTLPDYAWATILEANNQRNETLQLETRSTTWTLAGDTSTFQLNLQLYNPPQSIRFVPSPWYLLKFAWVQYLAVFIPFYIIVQRVRGWLFSSVFPLKRKVE
eukprot:m.51776 g.51776  ORF g.51776 m.51776 type:complete len:299 (-) comp11260_c0_seq4:164-1060(-)